MQLKTVRINLPFYRALKDKDSAWKEPGEIPIFDSLCRASNNSPAFKSKSIQVPFYITGVLVKSITPSKHFLSQDLVFDCRLRELDLRLAMRTFADPGFTREIRIQRRTTS